MASLNASKSDLPSDFALTKASFIVGIEEILSSNASVSLLPSVMALR